MICRKCNLDKEISCFRSKRRVCKGCHNAACRERYWNNIEASRERGRKRYKPEGAKIYYAENRDHILKAHRSYRNTIQGRVNNIWNSAKSRAKLGNFPFDLTKEEIKVKLMHGRCERTGIEFDYSPASQGKMRNKFSASIDKIDQSKGYVSGNVQLVVWCYNTGKGEMSDAEFFAFCKHVVEHAQC